MKVLLDNKMNAANSVIIFQLYQELFLLIKMDILL